PHWGKAERVDEVAWEGGAVPGHAVDARLMAALGELLEDLEDGVLGEEPPEGPAVRAIDGVDERHSHRDGRAVPAVGRAHRAAACEDGTTPAGASDSPIRRPVSAGGSISKVMMAMSSTSGLSASSATVSPNASHAASGPASIRPR